MTDAIQSALRSAASGMSAQAYRIQLSAENLSNVDTPGFRRKLLFLKTMEQAGAAGVTPSKVSLSRRPAELSYDPYHPMADENGMVSGSNVDLMVELADSREARRSYDANLQVFRQARDTLRSMLSLLEK
ncbi:MAG: flagellar basal body rod C-terminal domain-containing protein [Parvularcula sp.]|jgi:flagellar basal-body rod protein FlgC|nr:flagellar basal body rod C-terminal domain-containing protein [Parvularcula sp.]